MSTIVIRRKHDLELAEAKRLAENIAKKLRNDYGGSFTWQGDDLHFQRTGASGSVAVRKDDFQVRVELGLLLSALRSRIEQEIVTFCDANFGAAARAASSEPSPRASRRRKDRQSSCASPPATTYSSRTAADGSPPGGRDSCAIPPAAAVRLHQRLGGSRTPRAHRVVGKISRRQRVPDVQDRRGDLPGCLDDVGAVEERAVADHRVVQEPLVAGRGARIAQVSIPQVH